MALAKYIVKTGNYFGNFLKKKKVFKRYHNNLFGQEPWQRKRDKNQHRKTKN